MQRVARSGQAHELGGQLGYGITVRTPAPFAEAVTRVRDALKAQGPPGPSGGRL